MPTQPARASSITLSKVVALAVAAAIAIITIPARVAHASSLHDEAGPYQMQVLVDGAPVRSFAYGGDTWVLGHLGDRYTLRIHNRSARRVEAVATVDGRDVMDGKPGDFRSKRGYLVPAWGSVDIEGWRLSHAEAAAFRFSSVAESYAARTGGARDVGVIGVAIFPERIVQPPRPVYVPTPRLDYNGSRSDDRSEPSRHAGVSVGGGLQDGSAANGRAAGKASADNETPAPRAAASASPSPPSRPGLGTEFGEAVRSDVREVEFARANPARPSVVLGARYNDHDGLAALGIPVDDPPWSLSDGEQRETANPFPVTDRGYATPPSGWRR